MYSIMHSPRSYSLSPCQTPEPDFAVLQVLYLRWHTLIYLLKRAMQNNLSVSTRKEINFSRFLYPYYDYTYTNACGEGKYLGSELCPV